jgi:hypothetical protein
MSEHHEDSAIQQLMDAFYPLRDPDNLDHDALVAVIDEILPRLMPATLEGPLVGNEVGLIMAWNAADWISALGTNEQLVAITEIMRAQYRHYTDAQQPQYALEAITGVAALTEVREEKDRVIGLMLDLIPQVDEAHLKMALGAAECAEKWSFGTNDMFERAFSLTENLSRKWQAENSLNQAILSEIIDRFPALSMFPSANILADMSMGEGHDLGERAFRVAENLKNWPVWVAFSQNAASVSNPTTVYEHPVPAAGATFKIING